MSRDAFVPGQWNFICDRCGRAFKSGEARKTWDGLYTCKRCWEPRHPQDYVKGREERPVPPWVRPRRDTTVHAGPRRLPALFSPPIERPWTNTFNPTADRNPLIYTSDPFFDSVMLLLHGDGAAGSSTIVDSSSYNRTPTVSAAGVTNEANGTMFGSSALYANGGNSNNISYSATFASSGDAFTFEYFMAFVSMVGEGDGYAEPRGEFIRAEEGGSLVHTANGTINGSTIHLFTTPFATQVNWSTYGLAAKTSRVHVAWTRQAASTTTQLFYNGRYVDEGFHAGGIDKIFIGDRGLTTRIATAYVEEVRWTKGVARYVRTIESSGTQIFTPPTSPF